MADNDLVLTQLQGGDGPLVTPLVMEINDWACTSEPRPDVVATLSNEGDVWLAARQAGEMVALVGFQGINYVDRTTQFSIGVVPHKRRNGIATKLYTTLVPQYAFNTLNLNRVNIMVLRDGPGHRACHKAGLQVEGVLKQARWRAGKWWDVVVYGLLREGV